jgi:NTE family protein
MNSDSVNLGKGVAVSLSSSFFGFYTHAAFMSALHEEGVFPDQVAGTSSGSVVAALCGLGLRGPELVDFVMQPGLRLSFWDWLAPFRFPGVITSFYSSGILSGHRAVKYLRERMRGAQLEDFKKPRVQIAVTNLSKKESHMISDGDAAEWVVASCSIPGLFCNRLINGDRWCDGGVVIHVPFEHWLDDPEIHTIILHNIDHTPGTEPVTKWPTIGSNLAEAHETICKATTAMRIKMAEAKGKRVLDLRTVSDHPGIFPTKQRKRMIEHGLETGKRAAARLKLALAEIS